MANIRVGGKRVSVSLELYEKISALREERSQSLPILLPPVPHQQREVWRDDIWLEMPVTPLWTAAFRILAQAGRIVVGEARIFPTEPIRLDGGEWSGCLLGNMAQVPDGGLTTTMARQMKLGEVAKYVPEILAAVARKPKRKPDNIGDLLAIVAKKKKGVLPKVLGGSGVSGADSFSEHGAFGSAGITSPRAKIKAGARRGPKPTEDRIYLQVAAHYVKRLKKRSLTPSKDISEKFGFTEAVAKSMVREARRRGFLTPAHHGKRGGELTPLARTLLS